jgi:hypothetical protein
MRQVKGGSRMIRRSSNSMRRTFGVAVAAATVAAVVAAPAVASVGPVVPVSVPGFACPLSTVGPSSGGMNYPSAEVEPSVAVNPHDPGNVVAVWQQDRWDNGGANGLRGAFSFDAGASWTQTAPALTRCTGGSYDRATDPWVSFAPDDSAYFISISLAEPQFTPHEVAVARSLDGGVSWGQPVTLRKDTSHNFGNDKETVTADPGDARYVYAIWDRIVAPNGTARGDSFEKAHSYYGPTWFARTTNAGASWEPARMIYDPAADGPGNGRNDQTIGNEIVVLPNGTLVDGFNLTHNDNAHHRKGAKAAIIRSTDNGASWEQHATVIASQQSIGVVDPTTGAPRARGG